MPSARTDGIFVLLSGLACGLYYSPLPTAGRLYKRGQGDLRKIKKPLQAQLQRLLTIKTELKVDPFIFFVCLCLSILTVQMYHHPCIGIHDSRQSAI